MSPARTSGTKQRPITAPARATARGVGTGARSRARTASSIVSGTCAVADRAPVRPRLVAERPEQLLDVERDAVGPLVDGVDHLARRRQPGPQDQRHDERRLVVRERRQPRLLGQPLAQQPRSPLALDRADGSSSSR